MTAAQEHSDEIDANDLRVRLLSADHHLESLASQEDVGSLERARLRGKREGVRLALSYVDDALRVRPGTPLGGEPRG